MALEERSKNAHASGVGTSWHSYWMSGVRIYSRSAYLLCLTAF